MEKRASVASSKLVQYALVILIFVTFTVLAFQRGSGDDLSGRLAFESDRLTIRDSAGAETVLVYADMTSVEYIPDADFGEPVSGSVAEGVREGLWHSEALGDYTASAEEKLKSCALIRTSEGAFAISRESEAATKAVADALEKAMNRQ